MNYSNLNILFDLNSFFTHRKMTDDFPPHESAEIDRNRKK